MTVGARDQSLLPAPPKNSLSQICKPNGSTPTIWPQRHLPRSLPRRRVYLIHIGVLLKLMYACLSALSRQHQLQLSRSVCMLQSVTFVHAAVSVSVWAHALLVHSVGAPRVHEMLPPVRRDLAHQAAAPPPPPARAPQASCACTALILKRAVAYTGAR